MYFTGDTIRLKVNFNDFDDTAFDPEDVVLTIYDRNETVISTYQKSSLIHSSSGVYMYDYVTPTKPNEFIYEFIGYQGEKPMTRRGTFKTAWRIT